MVLMFLVVCSLHAMGASKMEKTWLWNFKLNNPGLDIHWISIISELWTVLAALL